MNVLHLTDQQLALLRELPLAPSQRSAFLNLGSKK